jgi:WD40 repeat protein
VIGDQSGQIKIYNFGSWTLTYYIQAHNNVINRIMPSPFNNGEYVATCSYAEVKIWSTFNFSAIRTYSQHYSMVYALEWLDAVTLASSGYSEGLIKIWSMSTGQTKREINTNTYIFSLKLIRNTFYLAAGLSFDIRIYNINDGSLVSTLRGHRDGVSDLVQIDESDLLASSSYDNSVRIWNLTTNECKFILQGHSDWISSLKQINSEILASASLDKTLKLWNFKLGKEISSLKGHTGEIRHSIGLNNNEQLLVSGSLDQTIKIWNFSTGGCLKTLETQSGIWSLAVIERKKNISKFFSNKFEIFLLWILEMLKNIFKVLSSSTSPLPLSTFTKYSTLNTTSTPKIPGYLYYKIERQKPLYCE